VKYILICNQCGKRFEHEHARYFCDDCKKSGQENEKVLEIEKLLREGAYRGKDIAKKFNVSVSYVSKIKRNIGLINEYKELI